MKIPIYIVKKDNEVIDGFFFKRSIKLDDQKKYEIKKQNIPASFLIKEAITLVIKTCWIASKPNAKRSVDGNDKRI